MSPSTTLLKFSVAVLSLLGGGLVASSCWHAAAPAPTRMAQTVQAIVNPLPTATLLTTPTTRSEDEDRVHAPAAEQNQPQPVASTATLTAPATATAQPDAATSIERVVIDLINEQRRQNRLPALIWTDELTIAARRHSLDMAQHNRTEHIGSDGSNGGQRLREAGYQWAQWDESIAWGMPDPADVVNWFLDDEVHRAVLLSNAVTDVGVGYVSDANTQWQRYWTVDVGRRSEQAFASPVATEPAIALPPVEPTQDETVAQSEEQTPAQTLCPTVSARQYATIPMTGVDHSHVDYLHGDLNLARRGFVPATGALTLIDLAGPTDADAPQLASLFIDTQPRLFSGVYQTFDWDWNCGGDGCRGALLAPPATLLGIVTTPGEEIRAPGRRAEIYGGGYIAVVLYADETNITLAYTRDGTVANGYAVHLQALCVDPNLLTAYRTANQAGRDHLPALRNNQTLGLATGAELRVAVRDRGMFLDPRSRKDWWHSQIEQPLNNSAY